MMRTAGCSRLGNSATWKMQIRITALVLLASVGSLPAPSDADTGRLKGVYARDPDGLQLAQIENRGERPACAIQTQMVIRDEKSDMGKAQFAMLIAAFLADRTVTIVGAGTCTRSNQSEDIGVVRYDR